MDTLTVEQRHRNMCRVKSRDTKIEVKDRGEWSEPYAFLKLLGDGRIYAADADLHKIESMYFPILKVIGEFMDDRRYEYCLDKVGKVAIYFNNEKLNEMDASVFRSEASKLYDAIINARGPSFAVESTEAFLKSVKRTKLKMDSDHKADIDVQIHDIQTGYEPIVGFSIKSELGHPPTLVNASEATNFIYEVEGLSDEEMETLNSIDTRTKINDRMVYLLSRGRLKFLRTNHSVFAENLMLVDSRMPELLAEALVYHYSSNEKQCSAVMKYLDETNPLGFPRQGFYSYKFKKFICAAALGLMPARPWSGVEEANGGYIIVTTDGDLLAYHIYNRDYFETYLLNNTIFERASTRRHNYCSVYKENGHMYFKLNLQIRFVSE